MYLDLGNIVGNSTPQWICMIHVPSNRRYQIRLYKLCLCLTYLVYSIHYLTHQLRLSPEYLVHYYSYCYRYLTLWPTLYYQHQQHQNLSLSLLSVCRNSRYQYIYSFTLMKFLLAASFLHSHKKKITKSIGAGIAGLALAIGLQNNNHHPFILYEEASEFSAVGYVLDNNE